MGVTIWIKEDTLFCSGESIWTRKESLLCLFKKCIRRLCFKKALFLLKKQVKLLVKID